MRNPIGLIGWALGAIFLLGTVVSYFYYESIRLSNYYDWTLNVYPYRQYSFIFFIVGIVFLVIGIAYAKGRE